MPLSDDGHGEPAVLDEVRPERYGTPPDQPRQPQIQGQYPPAPPATNIPCVTHVISVAINFRHVRPTADGTSVLPPGV